MKRRIKINRQSHPQSPPIKDETLKASIINPAKRQSESSDLSPQSASQPSKTEKRVAQSNTADDHRQYRDNQRFFPKLVASFLILALSFLLFFGSADHYDSRIIKQIWESGHFILFAGLVFMLAQTPKLQKLSLWMMFLITTLFSLTLGLATELLQDLIGRHFEIQDLMNDLLGGLAGLCAARLLLLNDKKQSRLLVLACLLFSVVGFRKLIIVSIDDWLIKSTFPVLANFESPFELNRWDIRHAHIRINTIEQPSNQKAMQIVFHPGPLSSVALKHFNRDWRHYDSIQFRLFNPTADQIKIAVNIYDISHALTRYPQHDRFELDINVNPGWNNLTFSLDKVKKSPQNRRMEMNAILRFKLAMYNSNQPTTLLLDDLTLSQ